VYGFGQDTYARIPERDSKELTYTRCLAYLKADYPADWPEIELLAGVGSSTVSEALVKKIKNEHCVSEVLSYLALDQDVIIGMGILYYYRQLVSQDQQEMLMLPYLLLTTDRGCVVCSGDYGQKGRIREHMKIYSESRLLSLSSHVIQDVGFYNALDGNNFPLDLPKLITRLVYRCHELSPDERRAQLLRMC
jgi:hypothetical protein